jgi:hypothetical protein
MATSRDDLAMIAASRTFRFEMTISVEPGHVAYLDPEWAVDAAVVALTDGYGIGAYYDHIASLGDEELPTSSDESERQFRSYRFSVTFDVEPEHVAYDDPEWAADAAHGALTNEYGIETVYGPPRLFVDQ